MKTAEEIAGEIADEYDAEHREYYGHQSIIANVGATRQLIARAIEADRAQRHGVVITADDGKLRIRAMSPVDAQEIVTGLIDDGYAPDEIEWEIGA